MVLLNVYHRNCSFCGLEDIVTTHFNFQMTANHQKFTSFVFCNVLKVKNWKTLFYFNSLVEPVFTILSLQNCMLLLSVRLIGVVVRLFLVFFPAVDSEALSLSLSLSRVGVLLGAAPPLLWPSGGFILVEQVHLH